VVNTEEPLVTVIIPCFNGELYVRNAIESVFEQTISSWFLIVVDDGSTDLSPAILSEVAEAHQDRMRVVTTKNQGACAARNVGLELATTKYVAFLDSDDFWTKDKLACQIKMLEGDNELIGVTSDYFLVDPSRKREAKPLSFNWSRRAMVDWTRLGKSAPAMNSTLVVQRAALLHLGGYNEELISYAEDLELAWRLTGLGKMSFAPKSLVGIRIWSGQIHNHRSKIIEARRHVYEIIRMREPDLANNALKELEIYSVAIALRGQPFWKIASEGVKLFLISPKSFLFFFARIGITYILRKVA